MPFTALVGQESLKKALILNAINPSLQGVLIRGQRGTAKSTAVRALADLLPEIEVVKCPFGCSPHDESQQCDLCNASYVSKEPLPTEKRKMRVVELPLGATEDRVVGTLDIEKALREGIRALQPGILADVNRGILYIDEVNLLDDHLVDVLLDSAAMGVNIIEREGVSLSHPSRFILVGTMNPEEGDLRPQLLDRFGLSVDVTTIGEVNERVEIIRVVEEFERDRARFCRRSQPAQKKLRARITKAGSLFGKVSVPDELFQKIAEICISLAVDGHRADILIARTARTIAAFDGRTTVNEDDVKEAASLVLPHRMRKRPFEEPQPFEQEVERIIGEKTEPQDTEEHDHQDDSQSQQEPESESTEDSQEQRRGNQDKVFDVGQGRRVDISARKDKKRRVGSGRRAKTLGANNGKYVKAQMPDGKTTDIAVDATIRASVARQGSLHVEGEDLREKVREKKTSSAIVFVVDASGSMGAMRRMEAAKGAVMALLEESYQKRDKVSFVAFRQEKAEVLLPPTSSVELAAKYLRELPVGGKTPLPAGLSLGLDVLKREMRKNDRVVPIMVLVSDGKGNVAIASSVKQEVALLSTDIRGCGINLVVIDSGNGLLKLGYNRAIAEAAGGQYFPLDELGADGIAGAVKPLRAGAGSYASQKAETVKSGQLIKEGR